MAEPPYGWTYNFLCGSSYTKGDVQVKKTKQMYNIS